MTNDETDTTMALPWSMVDSSSDRRHGDMDDGDDDDTDDDTDDDEDDTDDVMIIRMIAILLLVLLLVLALYLYIYIYIYIYMGPYGVPGSLSMGPYGVPGSRDSWTWDQGARPVIQPAGYPARQAWHVPR